MNPELNKSFVELKKMIGIFLAISFGIFLFILFFQPFPLDRIDENEILVFITGLAGIILFSLIIVRVLFRGIFRIKNQQSTEPTGNNYFNGFFILALSSVAFAFYLRFVGSVGITFLIMFKVVIICLAPPVSLWIYDLTHDLMQKNAALIIEKKLIQKQIDKFEDDLLNKSVVFFSENNAETLTLPVADVMLIKSADNYVEIIFREGTYIKKKLIRNTLRNVETQVRVYSNFIRCHRTCIVNTLHVEQLKKDFHNHWITIKSYDEQIPVSRQYLLKLKETV